MEEQLELKVGMSPEVARWMAYETGRIPFEQGRASVSYEPVDQLRFEHYFADKEMERRESKLAHYLDFYNSALPEYRKNRFDNPIGKAKVLAEYYPEFSENGKQPLIDRNGNITREPGYIGVIFDKVFLDVEKKLGYKRKVA